MNLLKSAAKVPKLSQFILQLHCKYCRLLNVFKVFSCRVNDPPVFIHSGVKVLEGFSRISKFTVTTRIAISCSRVDFFLNSILRSKIYFQVTIETMKLRSLWIRSKNVLMH